MTPSDSPTAESPAPAVPRYWLMSLGPNAEKWDECYDEGTRLHRVGPPRQS